MTILAFPGVTRDRVGLDRIVRYTGISVDRRIDLVRNDRRSILIDMGEDHLAARYEGSHPGWLND